MTLVETLEEKLESRFIVGLYRLSVLVFVPVALAGGTWLISTTKNNSESIAELTYRVSTLERSDAEFRVYRQVAVSKRDDQYSNVIQRMSGLEEGQRGMASSLIDLKNDLRELSRRMNERQGLLLPEEKRRIR